MTRHKVTGVKPVPPTPIEPKPPAFVEHFAWILKYWRDYKVLAGIAVIGLIGSGAFATYEFAKRTGIWWPISRGEISTPEANKSHFPALRVRFRDGTLAYVELIVIIRVDPTKVVELVKIYGEPDRAVSDLLGTIKSAAYAVLEKMSIDEARQNRPSIEKSIMEMTSGDQKRTFHIVDRVSVLEIKAEK